MLRINRGMTVGAEQGAGAQPYDDLQNSLARGMAGAQAAGQFTGSAVDIRDGYIHFSTAAQLGETARKHFHGQSGLMVLEVPERKSAMR